MKMLTVIIAGATLLSGCSTPIFFNPDGVEKDVSTSELTAQVDAPRGECKFSYPVMANRIVVDAGPVLMVQKCVYGSSGIMATVGLDQNKTGTSFRAFYFVAEPKRTYQISNGCLRSDGDATVTEAPVIICAPLLSGRQAHRGLFYGAACEEELIQRKRKDPSIRLKTDPWDGWKSRKWEEECLGDSKRATVIPPATTSGQNTCWPYIESSGTFSRSRVVILGVDAGPAKIDASCGPVISKPNQVVRTANIDFDAKAGHVYTISGEDEECMRLLDITSEEIVVTCEPYH